MEGDSGEALPGNLVKEVDVGCLDLGSEGAAVNCPQGEVFLAGASVNNISANLTIITNPEDGPELAVHEVLGKLVVMLVPGKTGSGKLTEVRALLLKSFFLNCYNSHLLNLYYYKTTYCSAASDPNRLFIKIYFGTEIY